MGEYLVTTGKAPSPGIISGILDQLQHGLGYSAYRRLDQMRKDDQLLRNRACELLSEAKQTLQGRATAWRKQHLVCTRECPVPKPEAIAASREMDEIIQSISSLETQVRNAALPESSADEQKHRQESTYLPLLQLCDTELLQVALQVRDLAETQPIKPDQEIRFRESLQAVQSSLRKRQQAFSGFLSIQSSGGN